VVDWELAVEDLLQVRLDISQAEMEALQRLELVGDTGGKGADRYVSDVAQKVLDANLFGFFGFDDGRGVNEGLGCGGSILSKHRQ
jgi:hypothetical protein